MRKQTAFQSKLFERIDSFGGALLKGNARSKRPIDTRNPIHVVLRCNKHGWSLRHPKAYGKVNKTLIEIARKNGITLYQSANVGNHMHLLLRVPNRRLWARFIREFTGRIAQIVQGLRGPAEAKLRFWMHKPFTRVVRGWGRAYKSIREYVQLNQWEGEGFISRKDALTLKDLRRIWAEP